MSNSTLDPSELGEDSYQGDNSVHDEDYFATNSLDTLTDVPKNMFTDTVSMTGESRDGFETIKSEKLDDSKGDPNVYVDEDTRMFYAPSPDVNSPRDIVSPTDPDRGEMSSPFSAMESDGMETGIDDASLSAGGGIVRRPTGFFGASTPLEYTTTPGASSSACDDNYESSGSRKKRRKTRRDMHPSYNSMRLSNGPQLRLPKPVNPAGSEMWLHDADTSPFSPPTCPRNLNFNFGESSSRRSSTGLPSQTLPTESVHEKSKRTKTCDTSTCDITSIKTEVTSSGIVDNDTPKMVNSNSNRRRHTHHRTSASSTATETESFLQRQYPKKYGQYELRILSQPEAQHRARYLTEGSRGPVKDATTQGYPKIQLSGYKGKLTLQVFVATDTGKIRPHGFYQACRVTGRNTSVCEEIEIDGTQVIEIPFKDDNNMTLNIDCVGVLKLRNTDVEVRTGVRNQKRNQSVRIVFRVAIPDTDVVLQVASSRISCTQPLGQPEITKKSLDRCSVEGGIDMFIIGKNFHRGTKVIYQDPEQQDGLQWSSEGEVDKDTFHVTHMVVKIPAYHDQNIVKPVNVQLFVEFQDKKCEPHSFTYMPRHREPPPIKEETEKIQQTPENLENSSSSILNNLNQLADGPIDKKFLVELFSKLITGGRSAQNGSQETTDKVKNEPIVQQTATAPFGLNNSQNFLNPTVVLPPQPQSFLTQIPQAVQLGTVNQKPTFNVVTNGSTTIPVSNPVTNFHLIQPGTQIPINMNPVQLATFTNILGSSTNVKTMPVDTNVNLLSTNANIKHEQSGTDSLPAAVVMATLPTEQMIQSVTNQTTANAFVQSMPQATQPSVTFMQSSQAVPPSAGMGMSISKSNFDQCFQQSFIKPATIPLNQTDTKLVTSLENTMNVQFGQNIFCGQHTVNASSLTSPQEKLSQVTPTTNFQVSPGQQNLFDGASVVQNSGTFVNPLSVKLTQSFSNENPPQFTVIRNAQNTTFGSNQPIMQTNVQQPKTFSFSSTFGLKNPESVVTDATMHETIPETKQEQQFQMPDQQQTSVTQHNSGSFTKIEQFPVVIQPPQPSVIVSEQQFMATNNNQQQATLSPTNFNDAKQGSYTVNIQPNIVQTQPPTFKMPVQQFTVPQDSPPFQTNESQISPQQTQLNYNKGPDVQFSVGGQQSSTPFLNKESQVPQHVQMSFTKSPENQFSVGQQAPTTFTNNEPQVSQQQTQLSFNKSPENQFSIGAQQVSQLFSNNEQVLSQQSQMSFKQAPDNIQFSVGSQQTTTPFNNEAQQAQLNFTKSPENQFTVAGQQSTTQFTEPLVLQQQAQLSFNKSPETQFSIGTQQTSPQQAQMNFNNSPENQFSVGTQQASPQQAQMNFNKSPENQFSVGTQQASPQQAQMNFNKSPENQFSVQQVSPQQTQLSFNASPEIQFTENKDQINMQQQSVPTQQQPVQILNTMQSETSLHGLQGQQKVQMHVDTYTDVTPMQTSISDVQHHQQSNTGATFVNTQATVPLIAMEKAQPMEDVHHTNSVQPVVSQVQQNAPIIQQANFQGANIPQMSNFQTSQSIISTPVCMGVQYSTPAQTYQIAPQSVDVKMVPVAKSMPMGSYQQQQTDSNQSNITNNVNTTQMFQPSLTQQHTSPPQQTQTFPATQTIQPVQEMITNQPPQQEVVQQIFQQSQEPHQQATIPNSHSMQMHANFTHPVTNNVTMVPVIKTPINPVLQQQQQQTENRNITPNAALGQTPDLFAMRQLLQSIDGSENLATITEEDVKRQFQ